VAVLKSKDLLCTRRMGRRVFRPSSKGLYYSNVVNDVGAIMVNTVDSNKSKYSLRQYSSAKKAHRLQDIVGRLSTDDFIKIR